MSEAPRLRSSIVKQDAVVEELWKFAANIIHRPEAGCVSEHQSFNGGEKTRLSINHVNEALESIMKAFGYRVTPEGD